MMRMRWTRGTLVAAAFAALPAFAGLAAAAPGSAVAATITSVLGGQTVSGGAIACVAQSDGVRVCHGTYSAGVTPGPDTRLKSFDGTPLGVYMILPPAPSTGADGGYPLMVQSHGYGQQAGGPSNSQYLGPTADAWARDGYAVLQLTARGFGDSCGSAASRLADPSGCLNGYIRLDDDRYEVRDIQYAIGLLVDAGIVDGKRIGLTGESYGGGVSLQLATLKDRIMNADGSLSPWRSPKGTPLRIAAAAPVIPWSDLVYSLVPNGRTLEDRITSPTADLSPIGVEKQSFVSALFALGSESGYYAPAGSNPQADVTTWYGSLNAGEPYDTNSEDQSIVAQIARYHSAYYLLDGAYGTAKEAPAPLLIANGFTDDLFPVDEAVRYYNLERSLYPSDPIGLFDFDGGHMRGQNKPAELALLTSHIQAFFDHYVKGTGAAPRLGATALTQTCPASAPAGGPFAAPTWSALHPGEVDYSSSAAQTILSGSGSATISAAIDPIAGQGACASVSAADQGAGVATYRLPAATGNGYTLLGAPTVSADLSATGTFPMIAERLWDVNPTSNTETLVARGVYRITSSGPQVFQLHPGAWHFAVGHIPKLELLSQDSPYARTSNGKFSISVSALALALPVHDVPGAPGTPPIVTKPPPHRAGGGGCTAHPSSRIDRHRLRATRHGLIVSGTAIEKPCAQASAAGRRRERVRAVYITVYRSLGHGRCRFLLRSGHLSAVRSCASPIVFRARGTGHWKLRLKQRLPRGRYFVRSDAVDGLHRHQRRSGASVARLRIR
jgi:X-Pro dipeptidyl-peptidase (S15 family)